VHRWNTELNAVKQQTPTQRICRQDPNYSYSKASSHHIWRSHHSRYVDENLHCEDDYTDCFVALYHTRSCQVPTPAMRTLVMSLALAMRRRKPFQRRLSFASSSSAPNAAARAILVHRSRRTSARRLPTFTGLVSSNASSSRWHFWYSANLQGSAPFRWLQTDEMWRDETRRDVTRCDETRCDEMRWITQRSFNVRHVNETRISKTLFH